MALINPAKLNISELDNDAIIAALQSYLEGQAEFVDFDFEGSGMKVLLRLLAYNTHYLSYYLNMVANEMYIDSADRRESIVSIAKQLGYTPGSRTSARAMVDLDITPPVSPTPPARITIDAGTMFTSSKDGVTYNFVTRDALSVDLVGGTHYPVEDVELREGTPFTYKFTVSGSDQRFIIPNSGVDTDTIVVRVQESGVSSLLTTYSLADDITGLSPTTTSYFIQEVEDGLFEVYFGDGILGKALEDGNIVYIDYLNCNADGPNGCRVFTAATTVGGYGTVAITLVDAAAGGAERESTTSIKFAAPKNYQVQNRAVTADDYKAIITRDYPNVSSVAVWGGETNVPPIYGKVFLSLKPVSGYVITENTKQTVVREILASRNIVSIIPVIIDPEYIYVKITSTVKYNAQSTTLTSDAVKALAITAIEDFADSNVGQFDRVLRYSNLTRAIDDSEPAITNNLTAIQMQKRFAPRVDITDQYTLQFQNAITPGTLTSTAFVDTLDPSQVEGDLYFFDDLNNDDGTGTVRTYKFAGTARLYTKANSGSVNYATGVVTLTTFCPSDVEAETGILHVTVTPLLNDIVPLRNNIIVLEDADITVTMQANTGVLV